MLNLYHASDLETLGELAVTVLAQPLSDPLAAAQIVVPSQGMGRWLTLKFARDYGIAMQLDTQLPASFIWQLARTVLGQLPEQSAFSTNTLTWRLYDWLCESEHLEQAPRLAHYLAGCDELRRYGLAARIADVYDQYLLYREDWLAAWERGERLDLGPDEGWQADIWQWLTRDGHPHRARLLNDLTARLHDPEPIEGLPERLLVFGLSSLPPQQLLVLEALAKHTDVLVFALNPSREAWGDIRDLRELARRPELALAPEDPDSWYLDVGHPLLASLGKQGRDFFEALFSLEGQEIGVYAEDDAEPMHLLQAIQQDILRLHTRRPDERFLCAPDDRSVEVHSCHSALREVEVLHDQLLARFAADPELTADQVVVLTPDIERYAPYIDAVFAARPEVPRIPYSLADRSVRAEVPLVDVFLKLLSLPEQRLAAEDVLSWLEQPALAKKAGLDADDLPILRDWLREANIRWGYNAEHRQALGLPATDDFSWQQGLDRLLLGFMAPPEVAVGEPPLLGEHWPLNRVEGAQAERLGRLAEFVEQLMRLGKQLSRARPLSEWSGVLHGMLAEFLDESVDSEVQLQLTAACTALAQHGQEAECERPVPLLLVRQALTHLLERGSGTAGFLTGVVTFCTMVPMRSLPFKHVCLLGLDDGAFPRRLPVAGFDLISRHPRRGDRARRLDDRYLLLETLLSARKGLYLSYVGADPRNNNPQPPSVLVSELLETIDLTAADSASDQPLSKRLWVQHAMQPFAAKNFGDAPYQSFSRHWFAAAKRLAAAPDTAASSLIVLLPSDAPSTIEPSQLLHCFRNPVRFYWQQRLGVYFDRDDSAISRVEPFVLEREAYTGLRELALDSISHGWPEGIEQQLAQSSGWLPSGELGLAQWGAIRGPVQIFAPRLFEAKPAQTPEPLWIDVAFDDVAITLKGWLDGVTDEGLFAWQLNKVREANLTAFWLRHLLLNSAANAPGRNSYLLCPYGSYSLPALSVEQALNWLKPWLVAYEQALQAPLPFFNRASHGFVSGWLKPARSEPEVAALKKARSAWESNEFSPIEGEEEEAWNQLAFRDRDALGDDFAALAKTLLLPLYENLTTEEGQ